MTKTNHQHLETCQLRLTLDVSYCLNGETAAAMRLLLSKLVYRAIGEGLLTGESEAEVEEYSIKVLDHAPADEEAITVFLLHRIESGNLPLEDIPVRLARYGLMDPVEFVAEMGERLAMTQEEAL